MKHNKFCSYVVAVISMFVLLISISFQSVYALNNGLLKISTGKTPNKNQLKMAVLSDIHYYSPSMISDSDDFDISQGSDRKLIAESSYIFDSAIKMIEQDMPDVLLITGDLTKEGEKKNHIEVAQKLTQLKDKLNDKGHKLEIILINGNHDVNNSFAGDYSSGAYVSAEKTSPKDFKEIYSELVYDNAIECFEPFEGEQGGLSYVSRPFKGYTFIAIDSCKYTSDVTTAQNYEHQTDGMISTELKKWIVKKADEARNRGDSVVLISHHGIIPHFEGEETYFTDYLVDDYEKIAALYADSGINYVFSGHMHANDIAEYKIAGRTVYDIETGSLISYPCAYRSVVLKRIKGGNKLTDSLEIEMKKVTEINYAPEENGETISDFQKYAKENTFSKEVVLTVGVPMVDSLVKGDIFSIFGYFNIKIEDIVSNVIFEAAADKQVDIDKSVCNDLASQLVSQYKSLQSNTTFRYNVTKRFLNALLDVQFSDGKTMFDFVNYAYVSHLAGEEKIEPWFDKALKEIDDGSINKDIAAAFGNEFGLIIEEYKNKISIDVDALGFDVNIGELLDMIGISAKDASKAVFSNSKIVPLLLGGDTLYKFANALAVDNNYSKDNNATITITRQMPKNISLNGSNINAIIVVILLISVVLIAVIVTILFAMKNKNKR